jgi:hypothetical protein
LRTSIVEGISVFLSLFDDNPRVKYCLSTLRVERFATIDRFAQLLGADSELVGCGRSRC